MNNIYGFWISPDSTVYTVHDDYGHRDFIEKLLGHSVENTDDTANTLFDDGWIRIVNTNKSLMVDYNCLMSNQQLYTIERIEKQLQEQGYFHEQYILEYRNNHKFFENIKQLTNFMRSRI